MDENSQGYKFLRKECIAETRGGRAVCALRARREALSRRREAIAPVMGDTYLKQHDAPEDVEDYPSRRRPLLPLQWEDVPPMMAKTVLDLLHGRRSGSGIRPLRRRPLLPFVGRTLRGVDDADIRFDNFR